ncbi:uncharacterized protein LOC114975773 isoform X3 [Acropora millepora]|uniref:uncharacterized protein LOC114975773 isoform X3 n=1 Tax=Acropora millepora TaxID=45264 RepID=UPI001CF5F4FA|nr:uncharacterized protein LOC114975773 isoform X3 [Acropora millepora]
MLLLAEAGRSLNKDLTSLFRHDVHTPKILERLVHELHTDKELCSYLFLNHPGSEDMLWGLINLLTEDSRIAGNASYVIGTLAETDLGKKRIAQICADRGDQARKILPALIAMLDMVETETVMNAAGTMGTLAEDADCRMWMLRDDCLDEAIVKLTNLLMAKDMCTASNAALVLARLAIAEEGCARILNHRSSNRTLMQLCRSLGSDPTGRGMNAAFAVGRLCDFEAGCKRMLSLKTSAVMINSLIEMLHSGDSGCCKNACFALSCIASVAQGHRRVLEHNDINSAVEVLCSFLACKDEESVWFASMMLHTLACQKSGCLYLRTQPNVKLSLEMLLKRSNLKDDTKDEVEATVAILEKLPKPKPPNVKVESACSVVVTWEAIHPKSGLDVTYLLYQDKTVTYTGPKTTYIANDLTPATKYSFYLQACTDGDDSPLSDIVTIFTLESVPSAPQRLRVLTKTTSQIKITWEAPAISNGVLRGYQVDVRGRTYNLDIQEDYFILSSLPPDTEFKFQVYALTSKGRGEPAILNSSTDDLASHAPPKPVVQVLGRHELLISWENPRRPLGRINSFEVRVNNVVVYSGVAKSCTAKGLKPSTEYTITVSAWCSEGRCESVPSKKRTAREVYTPVRKPLYPYEKKSIAVAKEGKVVKRAKTADVLRFPSTADSSLTADTRDTKLKKVTFESQDRPNTTFASARNSLSNGPSQCVRKSPGRRSSKSQSAPVHSPSKNLSLGEENDDSKGSASAVVGEADQRRELYNGAQTEASGKSSKRHSLAGGSASSSELFRETSKGNSGLRKSSLPVPGLPHRKSSRSSSMTSSAALIGLRTSAYDEKHRGTFPDIRVGVHDVMEEVGSLHLCTGNDLKPPKSTKKTQFAVSFDELKRVQRATKTSNSKDRQ